MGGDMQIPKSVRVPVDVAMTIISVFLMGGTMLFPDERVHKILGGILLVLWIAHHIFNPHFFVFLLKGKYPPYRIMQMIVNFGVGISALCLMASGIMMELMLPGLGVARAMHLVFSHWYFIFMSAHSGMHVGIIFSIFKSSRQVADRSLASGIIPYVIIGIICLYGLYAFIIRGIWKYLFYSQQFFFFDLERGYILFALDYFSILIMFSTIAYYIGRSLQRSMRKKTLS